MLIVRLSSTVAQVVTVLSFAMLPAMAVARLLIVDLKLELCGRRHRKKQLNYRIVIQIVRLSTRSRIRSEMIVRLSTRSSLVSTLSASINSASARARLNVCSNGGITDKKNAKERIPHPPPSPSPDHECEQCNCE